MAINYKDIFCNALLQLNKNKRLNKITVTDVQKKANVSRQTFYNHFVDIYDLIQYTYKKKIVIHWDPTDTELDFCDHLLEDFSKTITYQHFLKDSFEIHDKNNLLDYMVNYCISFEQDWMQTFYGEIPMPLSLKNAVTFAAAGAMHIKIQWIKNDINRPLNDVVKDVIDNENRCLTPLFFKNPADSPFEKAAIKLQKLVCEGNPPK